MAPASSEGPAGTSKPSLPRAAGGWAPQRPCAGCSLPNLGAAGLEVSTGALPWLPPFPLSLQFCMVRPSVCPFAGPPELQEGGRRGQKSPSSRSTIPWDRRGGSVSPQGSGHLTLSTSGDALTLHRSSTPWQLCLPLCLRGQKYLGFPIPPLSQPFGLLRGSTPVLSALGLEASRIHPGETLFLWILCAFFS